MPGTRVRHRDPEETHADLERVASLIRSYETGFVPVLLQTPDYAREVVRLRDDDPCEVHRRVELRVRRQSLLTAPGGPRLWAVLDEAALRRPLGGRAVSRAQLDHLLALTERPNVSLQVAPFHFPGHAAAGGPFTILRFADRGRPDVVHLEQLTGGLYLDGPSDVEQYRQVLDRMCAQIEPVDRTPAILRAIRAELRP